MAVLISPFSSAKPDAPASFEPTWESLYRYEIPEWFRDAKFGIWAHWGSQCAPEAGDWYARNMYIEAHKKAGFHREKYGHPSVFGFKDVINEWKAERFDADALIKFYEESGAKYFMAMANHHDNFDNFDSKHQPWNSVAIGPKRDLIGEWSAAARKYGLRFGVSVHASRAWSWYEVSQGSDAEGDFAGLPYDGKLTKADGKGTWWEGLDPQDLYAQSHAPGEKLEWSWDPAKGSSVPDAAYMETFRKRTLQLWDDYQPDQIYFDDTVFPFWGVTDGVGLGLAAHFYNSSIARHGRNEAVMNGKKLDARQRKALTYDIERGKADRILPEAWQTDTCIGSWHYSREVYEKDRYKDAGVIVDMLADIVSKNGNLMLSVPLRSDGTLDEKEVEIVEGIGEWLRLNGEGIYATRPWKVYGEGPSTLHSEEGKHGGQSDTSKRPNTSEDIRFTVSKDGKTLYAIVLAWPDDGEVLIRSLARSAETYQKTGKAQLLGGKGKLRTESTGEGLRIELPQEAPCDHAVVIKLAMKG